MRVLNFILRSIVNVIRFLVLAICGLGTFVIGAILYIVWVIFLFLLKVITFMVVASFLIARPLLNQMLMLYPQLFMAFIIVAGFFGAIGLVCVILMMLMNLNLD